MALSPTSVRKLGCPSTIFGVRIPLALKAPTVDASGEPHPHSIRIIDDEDWLYLGFRRYLILKSISSSSEARIRQRIAKATVADGLSVATSLAG